MKIVLAGLTAVALAAGTYAFWPSATPHSEPVAGIAMNDRLVEVRVPDILSANAQIGKRAFDAKCAACHNVNGSGREGAGPPLIHLIYEPSHHGDESFQRAAANGVQGHHWPFGNMPAIEGITRGDVKMITAYIRELQRENGIL